MREYLACPATANDGDCAVIEQSAKNALINLDRLDLLDVQFHGAPQDQPRLDDDAPVGDGKLAGEPIYPRQNSQCDDGLRGAVDDPVVAGFLHDPLIWTKIAIDISAHFHPW